jgi:hypothetical protein
MIVSAMIIIILTKILILVYLKLVIKRLNCVNFVRKINANCVKRIVLMIKKITFVFATKDIFIMKKKINV